jgi:predicted Zn-ribbon and HTH transcriptional regulator
MADREALWQLLLEDPSDLTCEECFAIMEFYAEMLATSGTDLLPRVLDHLRRCPGCRSEHREALRSLMEARGCDAEEGDPS